MNLKDQIAIVTGAGQGIGKACALKLAEAGANVVVADINAKTAEDVASAIKAMGVKSLAVTADLGSVADINRMIAEAVKTFGRIDTLVNNAGVTRRAYIMDLTEEDWDRMHRINAKGVFFCLQAAAREMIPRKSGRIINIASVAGKGFAGTSNAAYAATKGAVISLTMTAAQQLGKHNINVNSVCPGIVKTAILEDLMKTRSLSENRSIEEIEAELVDQVPIKRANQPDDIADMVVFLASPRARNITGQSFNVDGGLIPS